MEFNREEFGKEIIRELYRYGMIETLFNSSDELKRKKGWVLKSGVWSPWYLNLRPLGAAPELAAKIGHYLALLIQKEIPEATGIVGVDMAGIPLAALVSCEAYRNLSWRLPFLYTRPIPGYGKIRTPEQARNALKELKSEKDWGGHQLLEGRLKNNDVLVIVDDMVTSFGSKEIARELALFQAQKNGITELMCDYAVVVLDREQGAEKQAESAGMTLHSLIKFKREGLFWLKEVMHGYEFELIKEYQENVDRFQDVEERRKIMEEVERERTKK